METVNSPVSPAPKFPTVEEVVRIVGKTKVLTGRHFQGAPVPSQIFIKVGLGWKEAGARDIADRFNLGAIVDGPSKDRRDQLDRVRADNAAAQGIALVRPDRSDDGKEAFPSAGEIGLRDISLKGLLSGLRLRRYVVAQVKVVRHQTKNGVKYVLEVIFERVETPHPSATALCKHFEEDLVVDNVHVWDNTNGDKQTWTVNARRVDEEAKGQLVFHATGVCLVAMVPVEAEQPQKPFGRDPGANRRDPRDRRR